MKLEILIKELKKYNLQNIKIFNSRNNFIFDKIILSTSISLIHTKYIYKNIYKNFKKFIYNNRKNSSLNIYEWIIIDFENILFNIMLKDIRIYYKIDDLYSNIYEN